MTFKFLIQVLFLIVASTCVESQSLTLAVDYMDHGLREKALIEFILVHEAKQSSRNDKAEALYFMGQIAFDQQQYSVAIKDWKELASDFTDTKRSKEIGDRLTQLKDVFSKISDESVNSAVAQSYINNGDFWSKSNRQFTIDSSWMPKVEMANAWYDRVVEELPNTSAAEVAFNHKLFVLLGWVDPGQYGSKYGLEADLEKYMPITLKTFADYEKMFPASASLQAFRYQIAQAYWGYKDWDNTRLWLNKIIEKNDGKDTFYTETAKARLKKVEY